MHLFENIDVNIFYKMIEGRYVRFRIKLKESTI